MTYGLTRRAWIAGLAAVLCLGVAPLRVAETRPVVELPAQLSDVEFWRLVTDLSEPNGYFDSDNLVSNEDTFQTVIPELERTVTPGGVYLGVGPDQNFPYILAVRPKIAFITDVRRGNLHVHLMYKALIEMSVDRADFMSRLFARRRPAGLGAAATARDLFAAYESAPVDRAIYDETLRAMTDRLTRVHGFALDPSDAPGIATVYQNFFHGGPALRFVSSRGGNRYPSFEDLQLSTDGQGTNRGYLATEDHFRRLKALQQANLIVPIVGNFAGPKAIRAVGAYVKSHGASVSTFYLSNVERYLFQDGLWRAFAANVATLPLADTSTFIRSCFDSCSFAGDSRSVSLLDSMPGLLRDHAAGRIFGYSDVLAHSRRR